MRSFFSLFVCFCCLVALPAFADSDPKGINSESGVPLPIGAGQTPAITVFPATSTAASGNVLIGSSGTARANLEVSRGLMIGTDEANPVAGNACDSSKAGTLSQGATEDGNIYLCAPTSAGASTFKWKTLGKGTSYYSFSHTVEALYGQWYTSNLLQFKGDTPQSVSVTGDSCNWSGANGPYLSIAGGDWIKSGTISKGQTLQLATYAPCGNSVTGTIVLNTGGTQYDTWEVTTTASSWAVHNCGGCNGMSGRSRAGPCQLGTACTATGTTCEYCDDSWSNCRGIGVQTFANSGYYLTWDSSGYCNRSAGSTSYMPGAYPSYSIPSDDCHC